MATANSVKGKSMLKSASVVLAVDPVIITSLLVELENVIREGSDPRSQRCVDARTAIHDYMKRNGPADSPMSVSADPLTDSQLLVALDEVLAEYVLANKHNEDKRIHDLQERISELSKEMAKRGLKYSYEKARAAREKW